MEEGRRRNHHAEGAQEYVADDYGFRRERDHVIHVTVHELRHQSRTVTFSPGIPIVFTSRKQPRSFDYLSESLQKATRQPTRISVLTQSISQSECAEGRGR